MSLLIFVTIAWTMAFGGISSDQAISVLVLRKIPGMSGLSLVLLGI